MNLEYIQNQLISSYFSIDSTKEFGDTAFDLVAKRSKGFTGGDFYVLIKLVDLLEGGSAKDWQNKYDRIFKQKKGFFKGTAFCICIVANVATPASSQNLINHARKMGNVPCLIFVASKEARVVVGNDSFLLRGVVEETYGDLTTILSDALYLST